MSKSQAVPNKKISEILKAIADDLERAGMPSYLRYCNLAGIALLLLETAITLLHRGGKDYKWFCPCVFFYLISIIPSMIMLEYHRIDKNFLIENYFQPENMFT